LLTPVPANRETNFNIQQLNLKNLQRQDLLIFNPLPKVKISLGVLD
jgi:hypothetical protein